MYKTINEFKNHLNEKSNTQIEVIGNSIDEILDALSEIESKYNIEILDESGHETNTKFGVYINIVPNNKLVIDNLKDYLIENNQTNYFHYISKFLTTRYYQRNVYILVNLANQKLNQTGLTINHIQDDEFTITVNYSIIINLLNDHLQKFNVKAYLIN